MVDLSLEEWGEQYQAAMIEQLVMNGWIEADARSAAADNWKAMDKQRPGFSLDSSPAQAADDELSYWDDDGDE